MQNQRVLVLDTHRNPLMPCHPARARKLLRSGRASVFRKQPFTIIVHNRVGGDTQDTELRVDPGSKVTGCALVVFGEKGDRCAFALEVGHRSEQIKRELEKRRAFRRNRRYRKTRYRKPRFNNRARPEGWLPPSLQSRVEQVRTWAQRLARFAPVSGLAVETVRFDTQALQNPEISGVQYQQGELAGYEVREYLLEKWGRKCAYCGAGNTPLEIEHIVPRSRGGSDRVSNLTLSCTACNRDKGNRTAAEYGFPKIQHQARQPLQDAAAVNAARYAVGNALKELGLPVSFWSGGRTKHNRARQGQPKAHWIDAACVGEAGEVVYLPRLRPLFAQAVGRGSRVFCRPDRHGFPRQKPKQRSRTVQGFRTGDFVRAVVIRGKKAGKYTGKVAVRRSGSFNIKTETRAEEGISWKYCSLLQRADGYAFSSPA
jgi:5-methylcytosine-specific restriction endonuclease McrA